MHKLNIQSLMLFTKLLIRLEIGLCKYMINNIL